VIGVASNRGVTPPSYLFPRPSCARRDVLVLRPRSEGELGRYHKPAPSGRGPRTVKTHDAAALNALSHPHTLDSSRANPEELFGRIGAATTRSLGSGEVRHLGVGEVTERASP